jgi:hypothetical protein
VINSSKVFGPADLCFNAISLLIDIPSKVHEFHEAVDGLFEEVSVALSTFVSFSMAPTFSAGRFADIKLSKRKSTAESRSSLQSTLL